MMFNHSDEIGELALFSDCTKAELRQISSLTTRLELPAGRVLMREGDSPAEFLIVGSGRVQVTRETDEGTTVLNEVGGGEILGEMALLLGTHRTATVTALTDVTVYVCSVSEFRSIMRIAPSVATKIDQTLHARSDSLVSAA
jgi:CRP-like cAMP-binding protein